MKKLCHNIMSKTNIAAFLLMLAFCSLASAATITYTYDNLNRLTKVAYDNGVTEEYTYDSAGNRLTLTVAVENTPPTPNPMTWATQPYALGTTSISMVATTATDSGSPLVSYKFVFVNSPTGGTGGVDSGWQGSTTYTNYGLQPNQQYWYKVKARDSASTPNETSYSSVAYIYTLANTPGTSSFSNISQTGIQTNWTANGNRSGTEYYSENTTKATNSGWSTNNYWNSTGLTCGISCNFRVKARNGDGIETNWTNLGSQITQSCSCAPSSLTVSISAPSSGFIASQGSGTSVRAAVTNNCNKSVTGATVTASFSNGDASITLYDDGAHNDGTANDGVYANTWTPNNVGSCTINISASKPGLTAGNNSVLGTVQSGQYQLTTAVSPAGGGTVSPSCGSGCWYNSGSSFNLTAIPNSGYVFGSWIGDADCSDGTVTMNASKTCTATFIADSNCCISLLAGWNLISLHKQPANTVINSVLSGISGKYYIIWFYLNGSWTVYDPAYPGLSDLSTIETGKGYWIYMNSPATLTIPGSLPLTSVALSNSWNLVGYNSSSSQAVTNALASIAGKYISIWAFVNGSWRVYDPNNPGVSDLTNMEPGYGYWINMKAPAVWTLP